MATVEKKFTAHHQIEVMCGLDFNWQRLLLSVDEWSEEFVFTSFSSSATLSEIWGFDGTLKSVDGSELPKQVKPCDDLTVYHVDGGFFGYLRVRFVDPERKIAQVVNQGMWKLKNVQQG